MHIPNFSLNSIFLLFFNTLNFIIFFKKKLGSGHSVLFVNATFLNFFFSKTVNCFTSQRDIIGKINIVFFWKILEVVLKYF